MPRPLLPTTPCCLLPMPCILPPCSARKSAHRQLDGGHHNPGAGKVTRPKRSSIAGQSAARNDRPSTATRSRTPEGSPTSRKLRQSYPTAERDGEATLGGARVATGSRGSASGHRHRDSHAADAPTSAAAASAAAASAAAGYGAPTVRNTPASKRPSHQVKLVVCWKTGGGRG